MRTGKGLVSGVIALTLAILCLLGVLAFHFPQYLTTPELRKSYDVNVIRTIMLAAMAIAGGISLVNILFDPRPVAGNVRLRHGGLGSLAGWAQG